MNVIGSHRNLRHQSDMANNAEIPAALKNFVFDLYQASRVSFLRNEVESTYDQFKEVCDRHFAQSQLPDAAKIASECNGDKHFLLFYRLV